MLMKAFADACANGGINVEYNCPVTITQKYPPSCMRSELFHLRSMAKFLSIWAEKRWISAPLWDNVDLLDALFLGYLYR